MALQVEGDGDARLCLREVSHRHSCQDVSPGLQAVLFFVSLFLFGPCAEFLLSLFHQKFPCPSSASTDVSLQLVCSSDFSLELSSLFVLSMPRKVKVDKMEDSPSKLCINNFL